MKLVFLDLPEDKRGRKEPSFDMNGTFYWVDNEMFKHGIKHDFKYFKHYIMNKKILVALYTEGDIL